MANSNSARVASLAIRHLGLLAVLVFLLTPSVRGDEVLDAARKHLNDLQPAISILETAILQHPEREDYWEELLLTFGKWKRNGQYLYFCYAAAALKAHPDSLRLRWATIRFYENNAASDEIEKLAQVEPNKARIRDALELYEIGLWLPPQWRDVHEPPEKRTHPPFFLVPFLERWAVQCVHLGRWESAERIVKRALESRSDWKHLRSLEALILVQQEKYAEALAILEKYEYLQTINSVSNSVEFPTVGDLLLAKKQPRLAVRAFSPKPSEEILKSRQGLVLAQALLEAGELERSERLFAQTDPLGANLLVIGNLLGLKQVDKARIVADELMSKWPTFKKDDDDEPEPYRALDMNQTKSWPVSLQPKFRRAVTWLYETYPQRADFLSESLVRPEDLFKYSEQVRPKLSAARKLALLDHGKPLPNRDPFGDDADEQRASLLRDQRNYAASAEALRRDILQPKIPHKRPRLDLRMAEDWAVLRREAEAIKYYADHPLELFRARRLLVQLQENMRKNAESKFPGALNDEQITAEIVRMHPAVRALLIEGLQTRTYHGHDRSTYVRLLEKFGTEEDVPILISSLVIVTRDPKDYTGGGLSKQTHAYHRQSDEASAEALHHALEKITGVKNTAETPKDRFKFWEAWWQANLVRVLAEAEF